MRAKLVLEQRLQWKMNQSLLQAIHILQFSGMDLIDYIQQIAKENPLIEDVDVDFGLERFRSSQQKQIPIGEMNPMELSMYDQLKNQLYTLHIPKHLKHVIDFGIGSLNEDGYLEITIDEWVAQCKASRDDVEQALSLIQSLEPAGIGARTLSECIDLQLKQTANYHSFAKELLTEHLDWIAEERIENMIEAYCATEQEINELIASIKTCHPKPGQLLARKKTDYIIPEASIQKENGQWTITLHKWNMPTIRINDAYANNLDIDKEASIYIKEKFQQIDRLNQAITYRTNTLELVMKQILTKQELYFEHGVTKLQPLTLQEIADELDVNVSTVSRTINNKYVQTQHGVLPLKFFFQSGVRQYNGKQTAAFTVKQHIAELIKAENKEKPLSDEAIKNKLAQAFDIVIARRTVMKYRQQLNIPSSKKRK